MDNRAINEIRENETKLIKDILKLENELENKTKEYQETYKDVRIELKEKDKEIDRLKDLCNKYEEEHNTAFKLWTQKMEEMPDYEERMKLKKENDSLNSYYEYYKDLADKQNKLMRDYKSRIEKAIEYTKVGKTFDNEDVRKVVNKIQNDLLNILKGVGKDE